jgi:hypothetical protein
MKNLLMSIAAGTLLVSGLAMAKERPSPVRRLPPFCPLCPRVLSHTELSSRLCPAGHGLDCSLSSCGMSGATITYLRRVLDTR